MLNISDRVNNQQAYDVRMTLIRRHYDTICPLGSVLSLKLFNLEFLLQTPIRNLLLVPMFYCTVYCLMCSVDYTFYCLLYTVYLVITLEHAEVNECVIMSHADARINTYILNVYYILFTIY